MRRPAATSFRVAAIQAAPVCLDVDATADGASKLIAEARAVGATLAAVELTAQRRRRPPGRGASGRAAGDDDVADAACPVAVVPVRASGG